MIIDKSNPDHAKFPESLDGEVLLEITRDYNGNINGYITASQEVVARKRLLSANQKQRTGYDKYQAVIDALPAVLQKIVS